MMGEHLGRGMYFPPVASHLIDSRYVAQTFRIQVMQPALQRDETTAFPVVYATDGNLTFEMLKGISHILQASAREAPRFILVGIGYPSECPRAGAVLRGRDLTFDGYPKLDRQPPAIEGVLLPRVAAKDFGGAAEFQDFLEHELMPLVDGKYATRVGERTYFGHSVGGSFGLFTLLNRPRLFDNYIISSPGLAYDGESSGCIRYENYEFALDLVREFIASGKSLSGKRVYLSVGAEEEFDPDLSHWRLTSSFHRFNAVLRELAIPGLTLQSEVFAGETHATAWPIAFMHGLQALFNTGTRRGRDLA